MAIEFAFLGLDVTVIEKRGFFARNNSLHIWPSSIEDLKYTPSLNSPLYDLLTLCRTIGVKYFYPKFCVGLINHVSIRSLQCALLKVALILGVKFFYHVEFSDIVPPSGSNKFWKLSLKDTADAARTEPSQQVYFISLQFIIFVLNHLQDTAVPVKEDNKEIFCNVLVGADGEASHTRWVISYFMFI